MTKTGIVSVGSSPSESPQKPSVGRIVHYYVRDDDGVVEGP